MGESSPKGNDSELLDKIGGRNVVCISNVHVDWLIAVCHSNLSDTLITQVKGKKGGSMLSQFGGS